MFEISYPSCRRCERRLMPLDRRDGLCSFNSMSRPDKLWKSDHSCYMVFLRWLESRVDLMELIVAECEARVGDPKNRHAFDMKSEQAESYHVAIDQWLVLGCPDHRPPHTWIRLQNANAQ